MKSLFSKTPSSSSDPYSYALPSKSDPYSYALTLKQPSKPQTLSKPPAKKGPPANFTI